VSRGVAFNDLFLRRRIGRDFSSIRVRIRNEGAAVTLAAKVLEASGAEWTTRRVSLAAGTDWQWIEFARSEWHAASWSRDADGRMDFPLEYVTLIAFDVQPGAEYRIAVSRVDVVRPDPPVLTVEKFALPTTLRAGRMAALTLTFMLDRAGVTDDAQLVFRQSSNDVFRVPITLPTPPSRLLPKQRVALQGLRFHVPLYARGGRFSVVPEIGGAVHAEDFEPVTATIEPRQVGRTVADVKVCRGTPTLFINGEAQNGMAWATYSPTAEVFRDSHRPASRSSRSAARPRKPVMV